MAFVAPFKAVFSPPISSPGVAAVPWWLSGGIAAANCIAAYTPKGAASYAASLDNNAAPGNGLPDGTYDAIDSGGLTSPTWDAINGWKATVTGAGRNYLKSTIVLPIVQTWSMIIRVSGVDVGSYVCGTMNTVGGIMHYNVSRVAGTISYAHGGVVNVAPSAAGGAFGWAGNIPYRNGAAEAAIIPVGTAPLALAVNPLGLNLNGVSRGYISQVQAEAWYNVILTPAQMLAVYTTMAAL